MSWLTISNFEVPIEFRIDGLTTMMLSMVTFVSSLVAVFAAGYMAGDPGYRRFFALIGLFVFSMTGLVLSNNYVLTYVFWEGVGVCSYLLVGFWHTRPAAAAAAMKAFLVNRIGDFGFAIAIFWLWTIVPGHDLSYGNVLNEATLATLPHGAIVGIGLLLFWAATAKSAQIPLYVWLPDAMEGPTPVSALIHAATMVTAGVYLIARSMPLLTLAPGVLTLIAVTGCATALLSAAIAVTQTDLKRVLAYSTVSQLGYMFMALGIGRGGRRPARDRGGHVSPVHPRVFQGPLVPRRRQRHARDGRRDRHAAVRRPAPSVAPHVSHVRRGGTRPVGDLSPVGLLQQGRDPAGDQAGRARGGLDLPPDLLGRGLHGLPDGVLHGPGFLHDVLGRREASQPRRSRGAPDRRDRRRSRARTAAMATTMATPTADAHGHGSHVGHESPPIMTYPLFALAGCTILIGLVCFLAGPFWGTTEWFAHHLHHTLGFESLKHEEHHFDWWTALIGTVAGVGGLALSYRMYAEPSPLPGRLAGRLRPLV